jgi:Flp pilus assembly pilin Flp
MTFLEIRTRLTRLGRDEAGQTLIEYAGVALLVSIAVIVILSALGLDLAEGFDYIENSLGLADPNTVPAAPGVDDATTPAGVN